MRYFAREGAIVAGCARSASSLDTLRREFGAKHDFTAVDVADATAVHQWARGVIERFGAPVLVLICMCTADMDRYADDRRAHAERAMAIQGTAMAAQSLLLAAHAAGLGACWICAPMFCPDTVAAVLDLPADWEPQALVTLGYAAEPGKPFRRRAAAEVIRYLDRAP